MSNISKEEHLKSEEKWQKILQAIEEDKWFMSYGFSNGVQVWGPCSYCDYFREWDEVNPCDICSLNQQTCETEDGEVIPVCHKSLLITSAVSLTVFYLREEEREKASVYARTVLTALKDIGKNL